MSCRNTTVLRLTWRNYIMLMRLFCFAVCTLDARSRDVLSDVAFYHCRSPLTYALYIQEASGILFKAASKQVGGSKMFYDEAVRSSGLVISSLT